MNACVQVDRPGDGWLVVNRLGRAWMVVLVVGVGATLGAHLLPGVSPSLDSPSLRVGVEVTSVWLLLFAAVMLSMPDQDDAEPARDAFVAALVVLGLANGTLGVLPAVTEGRLSLGIGLAYYAWTAARYVVGLLFLLAAVPDLGSGFVARSRVGWRCCSWWRA